MGKLRWRRALIALTGVAVAAVILNNAATAASLANPLQTTAPLTLFAFCSGLALVSGIQSLRLGEFRAATPLLLFGFGIAVLTVGLATLDADRRSEMTEFLRDTEDDLARIEGHLQRPDLQPQYRPRVELERARIIYRMHSETIAFRDDTGRIVGFVPEQRDIDIRRTVLSADAQKEFARKQPQVWALIVIGWLLIGALIPADPARGSLYGRFLERSIRRRFESRPDGITVFRSSLPLRPRYELASSEQRAQIAGLMRRFSTFGLWAPFLYVAAKGASVALAVTLRSPIAVIPMLAFGVVCVWYALRMEREFRKSVDELKVLRMDSPLAVRLHAWSCRRPAALWWRRAHIAVAIALATLFYLVWKLDKLEGYPLAALTGLVIAAMTYFVWCRLLGHVQSLPPESVHPSM